MDVRRRIQSIIEYNQRSAFDLDRANTVLDVLESTLTKDDAVDDLKHEMVIIKLVTLIEVFSKHWLEIIVDNGSNDIKDRALSSVKGIKFDYRLLDALQSDYLSLGALVAHQLKTNSIDVIISAFSEILDIKLKDEIKQAKQLFESDDHDQNSAEIIIPDIDACMSALSDMFKLRHIIVHELPENNDICKSTLLTYINHTRSFIVAMHWYLHDALWWTKADTLNQLKELQDKNQENWQLTIKYIIQKLKEEDVFHHDKIDYSQNCWLEYARNQATLVSLYETQKWRQEFDYRDTLNDLYEKRWIELVRLLPKRYWHDNSYIQWGAFAPEFRNEQ